MVVDSNSTMERIMSPRASGCDLQEGRLAEQRPLKGIDWEGSTAALPKYFCWWSHMCFPFWARNCPWGWELISWAESLLATCSPTARASAVHWRGNEERQWVRQLVFFNIKRKGERLLILPCMRNWYWTWKTGKLGYCFCCYTLGQSTTIYAVDSASSTTEEAENLEGERRRWGWDSPRRDVLQGSQHFFFPHIVGTLSLYSWQMPSQGFVCSSLVRREKSLGNFWKL